MRFMFLLCYYIARYKTLNESYSVNINLIRAKRLLETYGNFNMCATCNAKAKAIVIYQ